MSGRQNTNHSTSPLPHVQPIQTFIATDQPLFVRMSEYQNLFAENQSLRAQIAILTGNADQLRQDNEHQSQIIDQLRRENAELKKELEELKSKVSHLSLENLVLKADIRQLKDDRDRSQQIVLLGEISRQIEKHMSRRLLGPDTRVYTFATLRKELRDKKQFERLDQLKKELGLNRYLDQMIDTLKTLRLPETHPHTYKDQKITPALLKSIAQHYYHGYDYDDICGLVDILSQLVPSEDDIFTD